MTIYLGEQGHVELQRRGASGPDGQAASMFTALRPEDVNALAKRFSFLGAQLGLISGDKIEIATRPGKDAQGRRTPAPNLELVAGHNFPDWLGYVNVDAIGGIRLYKDFDDAIDGKRDDAIDLVTPSKLQRLEITSRDNKSRCIAQIRSYEITTTRETIDVTSLNQQYRNQYHQGLISGQGRMDCYWEHRRDNECTEDAAFSEYSAYLAFLCVRLEQGAAFLGRFFLYDGGITEKSVWYECQAVVTSVVVNVEPSQLIGTTVDFITTGPIRLQTGILPGYLIQEDNENYILQEDGDRFEISVED